MANQLHTVPERGLSLGVAYFGNRHLRHATTDLTDIAAMGASYVVHTYSELDLRWNPKTMADLVSAGREVGLESWMTPWSLGGLFGGEAASYAVMEHPQECQRDNEGNPLPALCPRQPAFRTLMESWLDAVAASGASVCQWDEPHLARQPTVNDPRWACRCDTCVEAFRMATGRAMPREWTPDVAQFTHDLIQATVHWLVEAARARGLQSSIVLLPDENAGSAGWRVLAQLPGVRAFGVTPYWVLAGVEPAAMPTYLTGWCERLIAATDGTEAEPLGWLQAFGIPAGRESEIVEGMRLMRGVGIQSIAVWAYRACDCMSALAPDNPSLVWQTVQRAFRAASDIPS